MPYLMNTWYVAAWANEVPTGGRLARRLLDVRVVLYRTAAGEARALQDRCPHRFAPLSAGKVVGETLECGYHGLRFGEGGRCVHNPHGPVPPGAVVRSYPLVERDSLLWIWMGEADKADPASIPDFAFMDPAHWYVGTDYLHVKSNYLLEVDNIMDLSHTQYLHASTLGSSGVSMGKYTATREPEGRVWSRRHIEGEVLTPDLAVAMGVPPGEPVDRWLDVRWDAPANMVLFAGAVPTGRPRSEGRETPTAHLFTPETASSTHYWFSICFPKAMGEGAAQLAAEQVAYLRAPFENEDLPMLELQQDNIGEVDLMELRPLLLAGDAGAVQARRVLAARMAEEQREKWSG